MENKMQEAQNSNVETNKWTREELEELAGLARLPTRGDRE
jgi:hypothetical protein